MELDALNRSDRAAFAALLANVYEHAPWAAEQAWAKRPFASVQALMAALGASVRAASPENRLALVRAHPELAVRAAAPLTQDSVREQSSVGLDQLPAEEFASFRRLNDAYRARFGHPFIICVRRHSRDSLLRQFERRLGNSADAELATAFVEIDRIAALRLAALVNGPEPLEIAGRLSTHVLDTQRGVPAAGMAIQLRELRDAGDHKPIWSGATNADGRTDAPLIEGGPVPAGRYELAFSVGAYFASAAGVTEPPFLDIVPVRFGVAEPEGQYHVPLLVTPWSYATYRGS
jgi:2-oxo-4-hydroxy-4-carboxy-5-ureidoimidazoline decarboxylase